METTWADWFLSLIKPAVTRVMAALGIGVASYTGAETALTSAYDHAKTLLSGLPADMLALLAMGGFFDALSITSGGIIGGLAWMALKRFVIDAATPAAT